MRKTRFRNSLLLPVEHTATLYVLDYSWVASLSHTTFTEPSMATLKCWRNEIGRRLWQSFNGKTFLRFNSKLFFALKFESCLGVIN